MASEAVIWSESLTNWLGLSVEARVDPEKLEADVMFKRHHHHHYVRLIKTITTSKCPNSFWKAWRKRFCLNLPRPLMVRLETKILLMNSPLFIKKDMRTEHAKHR